MTIVGWVMYAAPWQWIFVGLLFGFYGPKAARFISGLLRELRS